MQKARNIARNSRLIFALSIAFLGPSAVAAEFPCSQPEYQAFDFWAGDWDVFDVDGQNKVASARVDLILDGCVLHEDYRQSDGMNGQSFTSYDATRQVWHQSWVTNRGKRSNSRANWPTAKSR